MIWGYWRINLKSSLLSIPWDDNGSFHSVGFEQCILEWLYRLIFDRHCLLHTWQVRPGKAARAGALLWHFLCLSSVASLRSFSATSTPFPIAFIHCVWSWVKSSDDKGAMLAFLRLLCRTSLNLSHCPPHLWAPQDSWLYMMSLDSIPSGILTTCLAQCSWADDTMVETAGIPAQESTSVLGTLSHQIIFIREHRWCCCSWSIWCKCLWYGHNIPHLYSRADTTTALYTLHLLANLMFCD